LSVKVRKAGARDVGDYTTHSLERRKEKAKGGWDGFMRSRIHFWCAGGLH
jgi:hypothetical protein